MVHVREGGRDEVPGRGECLSRSNRNGPVVRQGRQVEERAGELARTGERVAHRRNEGERGGIDPVVVPEAQASTGAGMRAVECTCGHHVEGADDEELSRQAREHRDHPELDRTDEQLRERIAADAYAVEPVR